MQSIDQEGKTVDEALEKALSILNRTRDEVDYEVLDEGSKGVLGVGARPILVRVRAKEIPEMEKVRNMVNNFLTELGISVNNLEVNLDKNDIIKIELDSDDAGILIGKHGQTLEALQYIVNQAMHETRFKFMVDISSYREKQNSKLIETVKKIAGSVLQSKRRITLKPMTAFERRMVHETIKEFPDLSTKSIGMEPRRRVVISLLNSPDFDERPQRSYDERPQRSPGGYSDRSRGPRPGGGGGGGRPGGGYNPSRSGNSEAGSGYGADRPQRSGGYNPQHGGQQGANSGYRAHGDRGNRPAGGGYNNGNRPRNPNYNPQRSGNSSETPGYGRQNRYSKDSMYSENNRDSLIEPGNAARPAYNEDGPDPNNV
jgi:spoIIIJ-associated protein